jgi:hypothetical protein
VGFSEVANGAIAADELSVRVKFVDVCSIKALLVIVACTNCSAFNTPSLDLALGAINQKR